MFISEGQFVSLLKQYIVIYYRTSNNDSDLTPVEQQQQQQHEEEIEEGDDEEPTPRKRRKPRTYTRELGEWNINETQLLCQLWSKERCLYDTKHQAHLNKPYRDKAVRKIVAELFKQGGITMTAEQVSAKMSSLRAYFSGQISKSKRAKANGGEYVSQWKFMDDLHFLEDAIIPRIKTLSPALVASPSERFTRPPRVITQVLVNDISKNGGMRAKAEPNSAVEGMEFNQETFTFTTHQQSDDDPEQMFIMSNGAVDSPNNNGCTGNTTPQSSGKTNHVASADYAFCAMILKLLVKVPEGEVKDMLKLKIHQEVLQAKYSTTAASNGNQ